MFKFGFGTIKGSAPAGELPEIYGLPINLSDFIKNDVRTIYAKILTDVTERTHGLADEYAATLWDSCLASDSSKGLITLLANAMTDKSQLFLVYDRTTKLLREANQQEKVDIENDYKEKASSEIGIFVSFKNYRRSDFVNLYSQLEYCVISSLNKGLNLSTAIQFKMADMRKSTGAFDSEAITAQAIAIAQGLKLGRDILIDGGDEIMTALPSMEPVKNAMLFLNQKRAFYLGLPESYINGIQTGGLGSTGEQDSKAIERGLKHYFFSVVKPVLESLFNVSVSYKSQDFRQISQGLEALKTFDLVSEDYISAEQKKVVVGSLFDLESDNVDQIPSR